MNPSQDDIEQQQVLLTTNRGTLNHHLRQRAQLGSAYAPSGVSHGIRETRTEIRRIKAVLRGWGVTVEDKPDDEEVKSDDTTILYSHPGKQRIAPITIILVALILISSAIVLILVYVTNTRGENPISSAFSSAFSAAPTADVVPPTPTSSTDSSTIQTPLPQTNEISTTAIIAIDLLNMRSGPGTEFDVVGKYPKGSELQIVGRDASNDWLYVVANDRNAGWMSVTGLDIHLDVSTVGAMPSPPTPTMVPATAVPVNSASRFNGEWRGTTSQGHPVTFSVGTSRLETGVSGYGVFDVGDPLPPCLPSNVGLTFSLGRRVKNDAFSDSHLDSTWSYSTTGNFSSSTTASGTFEATLGVPGSDCYFVASGTWQASKQ